MPERAASFWVFVERYGSFGISLGAFWGAISMIQVNEFGMALLLLLVSAVAMTVAIWRLHWPRLAKVCGYVFVAGMLVYWFAAFYKMKGNKAWSVLMEHDKPPSAISRSGQPNEKPAKPIVNATPPVPPRQLQASTTAARYDESRRVGSHGTPTVTTRQTVATDGGESTKRELSPQRSASPPLISGNVSGSIVTQGQTGGSNTVNNLGPPDPNVTFRQEPTQTLWPDAPNALLVTITTDQLIVQPHLFIRCSAQVTHWQSNIGRLGGAVDTLPSDDPKVIDFVILSPSLTAQAPLTIYIASIDPISVTGLRLSQ